MGVHKWINALRVSIRLMKNAPIGFNMGTSQRRFPNRKISRSLVTYLPALFSFMQHVEPCSKESEVYFVNSELDP